MKLIKSSANVLRLLKILTLWIFGLVIACIFITQIIVRFVLWPQVESHKEQISQYLSQQFDLKHDAGGMVDIEFMIQYIVLQYAIKQPSLLENVGNIGLIIRAGQTGIIAPELAHQVADAYRLFRKKQHQLRLDGHALARVAPELMDEALEQARSQVLQLWQQLMT
jgi:glutamate-ammonia-ligase adenylyltransferase